MRVRVPGASKRWLEFDVAFYYGQPYATAHVKRVMVEAIRWLTLKMLTCRFYEIAPEEAKFSRLSEISQLPRAPLLVLSGSEELEQLLQTRYLQAVEAVLPSTGRPLRISPWIAPDDTATYEVYMALVPGEEFAPIRDVLKVTCGEQNLLTALEGADPMYATIGTDPKTPTIGGLKAGHDRMPDCGYLGSQLVRRLGTKRVEDLFVGCPKVVFLKLGGVFYCWSWSDPSVLSNDDHRRYLRDSEVVRNKVLESVSPVQSS